MLESGKERHVSIYPCPRTTLTFVCLIIFATTMVDACTNIQAQTGRRPDLTLLETTALQMGESTRSMVLETLGEPFGRGMAMLPIDSKIKTLWSYYYGEGDTKDVRGIFLFVFFDEDRYDGYMWFSSLPNDAPQRK